MDVDTRLRQSRLLEVLYFIYMYNMNTLFFSPDFINLQLISVGDVVRGHVIDKSPREFTVQVTSFVGSHKFRELSDIGITVHSMAREVMLIFTASTSCSYRVWCHSTILPTLQKSVAMC